MKITDEMAKAAREAYATYGQAGDLRASPPSEGVVTAMLTAALAVQTQQGVEGTPQKNVSLTRDERHIGVIRSAIPGRPDDDNRIAVKQWDGNNGLITFEIYLIKNRWAQCEMLPEDAAKVAALILSKPSVAALVDVPAVESEPVAWQWEEDLINSGRYTLMWDDEPPGEHPGIRNVTPLFAHPPRSLSNEGEIVAAAQRYVDAVNGEPEKDCLDTEDGNPAEGAERFASDWAWKAYDEKKQQAFDTLRLTLSTRKGSAGDGYATTTKDADHG